MLRRVGFFVATPLLAVGALLAAPLVTTTHPVQPVEKAESAASIDLFGVPLDPVEGEPSEDAATDLYGNRVTPAVATYQLDAAGALYELHSPQTQLPRLGSPKS
ncbi:MAG TPA: hypothetical protein VK504_20870 [Vicinamibacterales bacterium]|jgi:hypothetical protein|nr:hypothetical protein [Vicinamibacterales bacterium]